MDSCGPVAKRFASPLYPFFRSSNVEAVEWMLGWGCVTLVLSLYITLNPSSSLSRTIDILNLRLWQYAFPILLSCPICPDPFPPWLMHSANLDEGSTVTKPLWLAPPLPYWPHPITPPLLGYQTRFHVIGPNYLSRY